MRLVSILAAATTLVAFALVANADAPKPLILSKDSWNKKTFAERNFESFGKQTREIVIHHTGDGETQQAVNKIVKARASWTAQDKARHFQNLHTKNKRKFGRLKGKNWPDIAYHYFISSKGQVVEGRSTKFAGDSNTPYDMTGKVLVVLEGNFEFQTPTDAQKASLINLVSWLAKDRGVATGKITGHSDQPSLSGKKKGAISICPGKNLYTFLPELRRAVALALAN